MKKAILFLVVTSFMFTVSAQNKRNVLINQSYVASIGSICEEMAEPSPCAGIEIFLEIFFEKDSITLIEKEVSSCDSVDVLYQLSYKWEMKSDSEIKIHSKPGETIPDFLGNFSLHVENEEVIGYKKRSNQKSIRFRFKKKES